MCILVGEPVDEASGRDCPWTTNAAAGRAADDQDVEPADVIGDQQAVRAGRRALDPHPGADDPRSRARNRRGHGERAGHAPWSAGGAARRRGTARQARRRAAPRSASDGASEPISDRGRGRRRTAPCGDRRGGSRASRRSASAAASSSSSTNSMTLPVSTSIRWSWWISRHRFVARAAVAELVPLEDSGLLEQAHGAIDGGDRDIGIDRRGARDAASRRRDGPRCRRAPARWSCAAR